MSAVKLDVPSWLLEQRRRTECDQLDEVWAGVLHMVPPPSLPHQDFEFELERALRSIAERRGLRAYHNIAIMDPSRCWEDYRVPDLSVVRPGQRSERAVDRAELVVEILSPRDNSREKLPFYASRGVSEVWLVDPITRSFEVFALRGHDYEAVPSIGGAVRAPVLDVELRVVGGPRLRLVDDASIVDV